MGAGAAIHVLDIHVKYTAYIFAHAMQQNS